MFDNEFCIIIASLHGHIKIVKYLYDKGANIHSLYDKPLRNACLTGRIETVKYLIEKGATIYIDDENCALKNASQGGHIEVVKYLIEKGANVHSNVLILACQEGKLELVKYFTEFGVDIHFKNEWALRSSVKFNHLEIVKYFN